MKTESFFPIVQLLILVLGFFLSGCAASIQRREYDKAYAYWTNLDNVSSIEASRVANLVVAFLNKEGIDFLLIKMHSLNSQESQVATVLLASIYELLLLDTSPQAYEMRHTIEATSFMDKVAKYAISGYNPAIRDSFGMFFVRLKTITILENKYHPPD